MKTYFSNGKLLLTGEYLVLDGAKALALPTIPGQSLRVDPLDEEKIIWKSLDHQNRIWYEADFEFIHQEDQSLQFVPIGNSNKITKRLIEILEAINTLNPAIFRGSKGYAFTSALSFPKDWGLGSSSTLVNNMAQWAQVDAFQLLELTFGGSGYDIACAQHDRPITYQLQNTKPKVEEVEFNPSFSAHLYFLYLNKKQDSREGIARYKKLKTTLKDRIDRITQITEAMINCDSLQAFESLMQDHETIITEIIRQPRVKERLFEDFEGSIKSLGAWGGDFVLVASEENPRSYFEKKGYPIVLHYSDLIRF